MKQLWETLCFFQVLPGIRWVQTMFFGATPPPPPQVRNNIIFDFCQADDSLKMLWGAVDDVVMGGVSRSGVQIQAEGLLFSGMVSIENSGGFASVRTRNFEPPLNLSAYRGVKLWVKGDGQRYKFFLRDRDAWDSVAYASSFDTIADQWVRVEIPFSEMKPVQRAKTITHTPLNPAYIYAIQLMLSKFEYDGGLNPDFKPGAFQLLIRSIEVY
jgi:hypothetical protein